MPLVAILFLIGCGYAMKGAWDHVRTDARASRAAKVKAATKAAGGTLPKHQRSAVARRHTVGWWAREVGGGFPAARTGWHAGWIAHKTALERQRVIREEARTEHIETKAGFRKDLAEHQRRQAEARADLERELAAQQAKGSPATGKKAVQSAAATVADLDAKRAEKTREQGVPPLPADMVAREPAVIDTPARVHHMEDSDWLKPGERRCEGCGGSGRNADGTDACPVCRGFGSAPDDPLSPIAAPGAVCGACGNPERPGDPVLATASGSNIHLSHARQQQEAYREALNQMRRDEQEPGPDASRNPQPTGSSTPSTTEGEPVSAETNYTTVLNNAKAAAEQAEEDAAAAAQRLQVAQQHAEEMQAAEVDPATLSSQMDLVDRLQAAEQAAKETMEHAMAVYDGLQQRHGGLKEAHDDAPVRAAQREFYEE